MTCLHHLCNEALTPRASNQSCTQAALKNTVAIKRLTVPFPLMVFQHSHATAEKQILMKKLQHLISVDMNKTSKEAHDKQACRSQVKIVSGEITFFYGVAQTCCKTTLLYRC